MSNCCFSAVGMHAALSVTTAILGMVLSVGVVYLHLAFRQIAGLSVAQNRTGGGCLCDFAWQKDLVTNQMVTAI
jgi:hypothetical protein